MAFSIYGGADIRLSILVGRIRFRVDFDMVKIGFPKYLSFHKHWTVVENLGY